MKKICSVFVAALLAVMLCVPAFAAEVPCEHLLDTSRDLYLCFDDNGIHYAYCPDCHDYCLLSACRDIDLPHSDECSVNCYLEMPLRCFTSGFLRCDRFPVFLSDPNVGFDGFSLTYNATDHYLRCNDCGALFDWCTYDGAPFPHVSDDCQVCFALSQYGAPVIGALPDDGDSDLFSSVSTIVTAAVEWLTAFALCIVSNPLLLVFVVCVFVGLGIGLVKRIIRL